MVVSPLAVVTILVAVGLIVIRGLFLLFKDMERLSMSTNRPFIVDSNDYIMKK